MASNTEAGAAPAGLEPARFHGAGPVAPPSTAITVHQLAGSASASAAPLPAPGATTVKRFVRQQVPDDILHDAALNEAIKVLPSNYNFEIHKTVWRLKSTGAKAVALQFPEGLLLYATTIADILTHFAGVEHCMIMGDVTYGACCVDDYSAQAMGADFLVHYGHSCLVPVDHTSIPCMYVFVDIAMDVEHLVGSVKLTFPAGAKLVLAGTIQFSSSIQAARSQLSDTYPSLAIPKCRPLSPGEVLGCTAPVITEQADAIVFVADGRFHLEAMMIANPSIPAYRYDPYGRILTREHYDQAGMRAARRKAVESAVPAQHWGLVMGTLGRQGNPQLVETLRSHLAAQGKRITTFLISELSPQRLTLVPDVEAWVQVACPRLSIDWGEAFTKPTLTPYEAMIALGVIPSWWRGSSQAAASRDEPNHQPAIVQGQGPCSTCDAAGGLGSCVDNPGRAAGDEQKQQGVAVEPYPMDYYAKDGGPWNSSYHKQQVKGKA